MVETAKQSTISQVSILVDSGKKAFLESFGSFLNPMDLARISALFDDAYQVKAKQFTASTKETAQDYADQYEAYMSSIQTIGDEYYIVGSAKVGILARSMAHQVIAGAFAVAGAVLQVGLGVLFPGVGSLVGAGLNAGLQHVVAHFLGA